MSYYVISIQVIGETKAQSIFAYDSEKEALSAYYGTLASNYASETLTGFCVMLINGFGVVIRSDNYYKPADQLIPEII